LVLDRFGGEFVPDDAIAADENIKRVSRRTNLPFALYDIDILAIALKRMKGKCYGRFYRFYRCHNVVESINKFLIDGTNVSK